VNDLVSRETRFAAASIAVKGAAGDVAGLHQTRDAGKVRATSAGGWSWLGRCGGIAVGAEEDGGT
jgi:hypothetical protein